jgi:hypothetical protein
MEASSLQNDVDSHYSPLSERVMNDVLEPPRAANAALPFAIPPNPWSEEAAATPSRGSKNAIR